MRRVLCILATVLICSASLALASSSWPGFRGPHWDGGASGRLMEGENDGLSVGWQRELGPGYSSVAVADGRVVTMFADGDGDFVGAYDVEGGEELWRYRIGDTYKGHDGSHDGPISTPLLTDGRVYGFGPYGHLFALDAKTGEEIWAKDVVAEHEAKKPHYGFTSSPVLVDGMLVVQIGAEGKSIAGFDPDGGALKWTIGEDGVEYQSPIVVTIDGRRQVMAVDNKKLFGIDAAKGEVLWSYEHGGDQRALGGPSMVPVPAGENRFFLMNTIDSSTMVSIGKGKELDYEVQELWSGNAIKNSYVVPLYHDGYIYGINNRVLTCVDAATGEIAWRSRNPGDAFLTRVGNKLVAMTKPGTLHVALASPDGYTELASLELFDEHSWSEVAAADGHLFARSMGRLARIDVEADAESMRAANAWVASTEFGRFLAKVHDADDKEAVIDAFMDEQPSFPIVEGTDVVHFVYRGEASDVGIVGDMIGFRREDPMTRVPGTDLFFYSMRLEPDAAVTYGFMVDFAAEATADPLNSTAASGRFGEVSWLAMPAWRNPDYIAEAKRGRQGKLETVEMEYEKAGPPAEGSDEPTTVMAKRTAQVYLPAGFDASGSVRYPTVYVHGGKDALEQGQMKNALDNLIGDSVEPMIAVFIMQEEGENAGMRPDAYVQMIVDTLVPLIDERYPTRAEASGRATIGAGNGGRMAMMAAIGHSDVFGRMGSQSAVLFGMNVGDMLSNAAEKPLSIYLNWGTYDFRSPHEAWDMAKNNREAWSALRDAGYRPAGGEVPEGAAWNCWRGHTGALLTALFPQGS